MEKVQQNSINKKQNDLNNRKMTNCPPSPVSNLVKCKQKTGVHSTGRVRTLGVTLVKAWANQPAGSIFPEPLIELPN